MQNRRELRETVLKALYAIEFSDDSAEEIQKKIIKPSLKDSSDSNSLEFMDRLFFRALNLKIEVEKLIEPKLANWELERLASIDKIVIRMGVTEFLFFDDIPTKVTINECIELAKKYSTAKSGKFVNGLLESLLTELQQANKVIKKGRGLIQQRLNSRNR